MRDNITMNIFTNYDSQTHNLIRIHILLLTSAHFKIPFTDAYSQNYNSQIQNIIYKHKVQFF